MNRNEFQSRLSTLLHALYPAETATVFTTRITTLVERIQESIPGKKIGWSQRDVLLITYPDTITRPQQASLDTLSEFLSHFVGDLATFVHILPFFPYTSDQGFSITDYRRVSVSHGGWGHIRRLGQRYRIAIDAVINHVSASGIYMQRLLQGDSHFRDFFIHVPEDADLSRVVRPRSSPLTHTFDSPFGKLRLWTTFSRDQIDLDYHNPHVLYEILDVLLQYARQHASLIRLDAIAYIWKEYGTACINLPGAHTLVRIIRLIYDAVAPHMLLLTETNVPHKENISYFGNGDDEAHMVYNFTLPPMIAHTIITENASALQRWAATLEPRFPGTCFLNFTASHDGVGVRPTEGLLNESQRTHLCDCTRARGGTVSYKLHNDGTHTPYELNITWFDMLNDPHAHEPPDLQIARFIVSQAIALSFRGIPALYIHTLFGTRNDYAAVRKSGIARSINRAQLDFDMLRQKISKEETIESKVYSALQKLLRIRISHTAFHPEAPQRILDCGPEVFGIVRNTREDNGYVVALHNVTAHTVPVSTEVFPTDASRYRDMCTDTTLTRSASASVPLEPFQVAWYVPYPD